ncbi:hypothetical protein [Fluviicola taffensis]|uniref:Uncharacterized protein n=1 Tax=Fluviicola taffensis (strain DSM 16823 / NCIMB 13979 / RW262) TaxID=755732 RepID=F2IFW0_FLUTR|nr:hypothetical protein [Fluviicola taffensis]AEA43581.1 hypothetical protein Fluta_1589 [Fluviicola taffensis DSM 16823]
MTKNEIVTSLLAITAIIISIISICLQDLRVSRLSAILIGGPKVNIVKIEFSSKEYSSASNFDHIGLSFNFLDPKGNGISYFHEIKGIEVSSVNSGR